MIPILISWLGQQAGTLLMIHVAAIIAYGIVKWIFGKVNPGGRIALIITVLFLIWVLTIQQ